MALSSNEHDLLVSTCENMNVAAGTCREVLEMLRNLGNTGVVDIATHNNSQGAHANDKTLAHAGDTGTSSYVVVGTQLYSGYNYPGQQTNNPITLMTSNGSNEYLQSCILMQARTQNGNAGPLLYIRSDELLTNSNGELVSFDGYDQSKLHWNRFSMLTGYLHGANDEALSAKLFYAIGRSWARGDQIDIAGNSHAMFEFWLSNSLTTEICSLTIDDLGITPGSTNTEDLGAAGCVFKDLYLHNAVTVTSDRREKRNISMLGGEAVEFIKALRPVKFKLAESVGAVQQRNSRDESSADPILAEAGSRSHWGLIAQEVHEALVSAGYDPSDCAVWSLADKNDPDSKQALRYEELIAPMIKVIQQQQERIEALERKVA